MLFQLWQCLPFCFFCLISLLSVVAIVHCCYYLKWLLSDSTFFWLLLWCFPRCWFCPTLLLLSNTVIFWYWICFMLLPTHRRWILILSNVVITFVMLSDFAIVWHDVWYCYCLGLPLLVFRSPIISDVANVLILPDLVIVWRYYYLTLLLFFIRHYLMSLSSL